MEKNADLQAIGLHSNATSKLANTMNADIKAPPECQHYLTQITLVECKIQMDPEARGTPRLRLATSS